MPCLVRRSPVRIALTDHESGDPIGDLTRTHTEWMHVVVTRSDLGTFAHVHPEPTGDAGAYTVDVDFPTAGSYHVDVEFHRRGEMTDIVDRATVEVGGAAPDLAPVTEPTGRPSRSTVSR